MSHLQLIKIRIWHVFKTVKCACPAVSCQQFLNSKTMFLCAEQLDDSALPSWSIEQRTLVYIWFHGVIILRKLCRMWLAVIEKWADHTTWEECSDWHVSTSPRPFLLPWPTVTHFRLNILSARRLPLIMPSARNKSPVLYCHLVPRQGNLAHYELIWFIQLNSYALKVRNKFISDWL